MAETGQSSPVASERVVWNVAGWPTIFELDVGAKFEVTRMTGDRTVRRMVKLIDVEHLEQPDYWIAGAHGNRTLAGANIQIEVDGQPATLHLRPYQHPVIVNGLRLYVETTRNWDAVASYRPVAGVQHDVRFSAVAEDESWGPAELVFPLADYRWRSGTYHNTWSALVPYNQLYYHRGEDFGAIPDHLPVQACLSGRISASPLPEGDKGSNRVHILHPSGLEVLYAHMNLEQIAPEVLIGEQIRSGQLLGKSGETWAGRKAQHKDPHLHIGFLLDDSVISPYPYLMEAYFRRYGDAVLANAGGYLYAKTGMTLELDASRSVARPGRKITSMKWKLHDGREVDASSVPVTYAQPGLYSEELIVTADDGSEDRDFTQVRVYDPQHGRDLAFGWFYHTPTRGLQPGTPITFWNRITKTSTPIMIDFGDTSAPQPIESQIEHPYSAPGIYTASLTGSGPSNEPFTVKMRIVIESAR